MYRAYIFDLDGTLLDTLDDLWTAVNVALEKYGYPLRTREEVRAFVGDGVRKLMKRASDDADGEAFESLFAEFKRYYGENCTRKTKPYDDVIDVLKSIRAVGGRVAIVSNKSDFAVKRLSEEYFGALVDFAVGENEEAGIRKKPAPDSVFAAMHALGVEREACVYVGDSDVDILTAKNAGIDCISVTWGFREKPFLLERGATRFADTPEELLRV